MRGGGGVSRAVTETSIIVIRINIPCVNNNIRIILCVTSCSNYIILLKYNTIVIQRKKKIKIPRYIIIILIKRITRALCAAIGGMTTTVYGNYCYYILYEISTTDLRKSYYFHTHTQCAYKYIYINCLLITVSTAASGYTCGVCVRTLSQCTCNRETGDPVFEGTSAATAAVAAARGYTV